MAEHRVVPAREYGTLCGIRAGWLLECGHAFDDLVESVQAFPDDPAALVTRIEITPQLAHQIRKLARIDA